MSSILREDIIVSYLQEKQDISDYKLYSQELGVPISTLKTVIKRNPALIKKANITLKADPFNYLLSQVNRRALKNRDKYGYINFTGKQLRALYELQKGKDPFWNVQMNAPVHPKSGFLKPYSLFNASIDRIDSRLPYRIDNIQIVCVGTNIGKNHHTNEDYLIFVEECIRCKSGNNTRE